MRKFPRTNITAKAAFFFGCSLCFVTLLSSCSTLRSFGRPLSEERIERISASPNWEKGHFHNQDGITPGKIETSVVNNILVTLPIAPGKRPKGAIPTVKTDISALDTGEDFMLWFGHSSVLLQCSGYRILADPVLTSVFPTGMFVNPFKGTNVYCPDDIPQIDVLLITHSHFDHLDYYTLRSIRDRVGMVVCPLGIGEYLEYWGYPAEKIHELDWDDSVRVSDSLNIRALPSVHASVRFLRKNRTLWSSFLIEAGKTVFLSGDGGYGRHFEKIGSQYDIDLAILENGQYFEGARLHTTPDNLRKEIRDLHPKRLFTYHNSKFSLEKHPWDEPMRLVYEYAVENGIGLYTPLIGEPVYLDRPVPAPNPWWESVDDNAGK